MKPQPTELHCYRPNPRPDLSPRDHAVLQVLLDARGMFVRGGFEILMIAAQLKMRRCRMSAREIGKALESLHGRGFAERVDATRWRAAR